MASTQFKRINENGERVYKIRVSMGRGKPTPTIDWTAKATWSEKTIEKKLAEAARDFENECKSGAYKTKAEQLAIREEEQKKEEAEYTFKRYAEEVFLPYKESVWAENTRLVYRNALRNHVYPAFGDDKLKDITAMQVEQYLFKMKQSGCSHSAVQKSSQIINMVLEKARRAKLINENVMHDVEVPKQAKEERCKEVEAYSPEEMSYILGCLEKEPLKWKAYIWLLADTGCRRGEGAGLCWSDVDFSTGSITISHSLGYSKEKGIYLSSPKSGKCRTVDLDESVLDMLRQIKEKQKADGINTPFVFTQDGSGEPLFPTSPTRYCKQFGEKYRVPGFHPHILRHSFASIAITNGADVVSVSEKLGHASPAITLNLYSHANAESIKRAGNIYRQVVSNVTKAG